MKHRSCLFLLPVLIFSLTAFAQDSKSDFSLNLTGTYTKNSGDSFVSQGATKSAGFLASYRFSFTPHQAVEANYGYTKNSQNYFNGDFISVQAGVHELTGAYVLKASNSRFSPFAFAGTGALGLEAISHGARYCLFIDDAAESRALIRKNVESLELTGATKIWRRDATQLGAMPVGSGGPFDLVLLDPPYRKNLVAPSLASLAAGNWLVPKALLVVETAEKEQLILPAGFCSLNARIYGDTRVEFLVAGENYA